tara:strand:- start:432 stop:560 length:129 start_codon:yes stop_codon:yes gene_type:complete
MILLLNWLIALMKISFMFEKIKNCEVQPLIGHVGHGAEPFQK